jgi:hypothetical protein
MSVEQTNEDREPTKRLPYDVPKLVVLGSIEELTKGNPTGTLIDGDGGFS